MDLRIRRWAVYINRQRIVVLARTSGAACRKAFRQLIVPRHNREPRGDWLDRMRKAKGIPKQPQSDRDSDSGFKGVSVEVLP